MQTLWKTVWQFLEKINRITAWPCNSTPDKYSEELKASIQANAGTSVFITAVFTIGRHKQMSANGWTTKVKYLYSGIRLSHKKSYSCTKSVNVLKTLNYTLKNLYSGPTWKLIH